MTKWYQSKYVQAAGIALATGLIAALGAYLTTMTDGLDTRHTIKFVGEAFLLPFATLVSVLPKITDLIVPKVTLVSAERLSLPGAEAAPESVVTTQSANPTVVVDAPVDAPPVSKRAVKT